MLGLYLMRQRIRVCRFDFVSDDVGFDKKVQKRCLFLDSSDMHGLYHPTPHAIACAIHELSLPTDQAHILKETRLRCSRSELIVQLNRGSIQVTHRHWTREGKYFVHAHSNSCLHPTKHPSRCGSEPRPTNRADYLMVDGRPRYW